MPIEQTERTLLVIRHAKSSWEVGVLNDFERPLNERGKRDAPEMAKKLNHRNIQVNAFVSSPAVRATQTAAFFITEYGRSASEIIFVPELYHAGVDVFVDVVQKMSDTFKTVAIFSHNPGITEFVNLLFPEAGVMDMPTCGVFGVNATCNSWKDFTSATKSFLLFDFPKNSA